MIAKLENSSHNFTKFKCLKSQFNYNNNIILKEFHTLYLESDNDKSYHQLDYIIWRNNEYLKRIKKSHHLYIGATF